MNRIEYIKSQLMENQRDPFLHFALAQEYSKAGQWQMAKEKYDHLLEHHPEYVGTYYHAAKLQEKLGNGGRAAVIYREGISVAKGQQELHAMRELQEALFFLDEEE